MVMTLTIWHNPRCSKSRRTLELLKENGIDPEVRLYLVDPPSRREIDAAAKALGKPAAEFVRKGEADYKVAGLSKTSSEDEIRAAMEAHPKLIERPIVFSNKGAAIGRPAEAVLDLL